MAVAGIATFPLLRIDVAANGYTLVAMAGGLTMATSGNFDVVEQSALRVHPTLFRPKYPGLLDFPLR